MHKFGGQLDHPIPVQEMVRAMYDALATDGVRVLDDACAVDDAQCMHMNERTYTHTCTRCRQSRLSTHLMLYSLPSLPATVMQYRVSSSPDTASSAGLTPSHTFLMTCSSKAFGGGQCAPLRKLYPYAFLVTCSSKAFGGGQCAPPHKLYPYAFLMTCRSKAFGGGQCAPLRNLYPYAFLMTCRDMFLVGENALPCMSCTLTHS